MVEKSEFVNLVVSCIREIGEIEGKPKMANTTEDSRLLGSSGVLDSLGLVFLISELEDQVAEIYGLDLVLADEKAMSQAVSPFRTVRSLASHLERLITAQ